MVKVIVPNPQYAGTIAEVRFHNGVGHFEDAKLAERIAAQFGFEVEKEKPEPKAEAVPEAQVKSVPKRNKRKAGD
jgi:hypothetical protein